jgi:hypothetical protein
MRTFVLLALLLLVLSCRQNRDTQVRDLYRWLNDVDNGLTKTKIIDDVQITVKYLPAQLQAYRELEGKESKFLFDSLVSGYSNQKTFIMSFKSIFDDKNIVYKDVSDKKDYDQRIMDLSFNMGRKLKITACGSDLGPTLFHYEPSYGSNKTINVYVVFAGEKVMSCMEPLDIEYYDNVFNTGISHFTFKQEDIDRIPEIKI